MKLTERQIQETGRELLALDGWRLVKTDMPQLRGLGVQEKGIADDLFIRYTGIFHNFNYDCMKQALPTVADMNSLAQVLWIEWKAPKGKATQHQLDWHAAERARGALTWIAGIDFTASIEGFEAHYFKSGLARKVRQKGAKVAASEGENGTSRLHRN